MIPFLPSASAAYSGDDVRTGAGKAGLLSINIFFLRMKIVSLGSTISQTQPYRGQDDLLLQQKKDDEVTVFFVYALNSRR